MPIQTSDWIRYIIDGSKPVPKTSVVNTTTSNTSSNAVQDALARSRASNYQGAVKEMYPWYYPGALPRIPGSTYTIKNNTPLIVSKPGISGVPYGLGMEFDFGFYNYAMQQQAQNQAQGGGGYSGGGYSGPQEPPAPPPLTWSEKYQLEGSPSWWKGMMPSQMTPETEFAVIMNTLIPYLSTEDQRQFASNLSRLFPDAFGHYSPEQSDLGTPSVQMTAQQKDYFLSQKRAGDILGAMDKMREASGQDEKKFGPGYQYMRQLAATMKDFGKKEGYNMPTRADIVKMYSAFDPMLSETSGQQLGAYGEVARSLAQPFFGAGKLVNVGRDEQGNWKFTGQNKSWF